MTTPSEQWIVGALRQATDRIPLPPESSWVREHRSSPRMPAIAAVGAAAIFIVAVGLTIGALRVEPRLAPAAGPDAFAVAEDTEWRIARFVIPSNLALMRPAWIPGEYRGSAECLSPQAIIGIGGIPSRPSAPSGYSVEYRRQQPDGRCASLILSGHLGTQDIMDEPGGLVGTNIFDARGTTVHVRTRVSPTTLDAPLPLRTDFLWHLWWNESGAHYDVYSNDPDLEPVDLVRVVRSLEPMR